jgi:hypothetical protein
LRIEATSSTSLSAAIASASSLDTADADSAVVDDDSSSRLFASEDESG